RLTDPYTHATYSVIGVAPPGLDYPVGVGAWTQIGRLGTPQVFVVGRLLPGKTVDAARAELVATVNRLEPGFKLTGATGQTLTAVVLGEVRPVFIALIAAVALLLLIACVNVGNLFL